MYTNEIILKVLGKTVLEYPELDQNLLKGILEEVLYGYEVQPMSTALTVQDNLQDMIILFLAAKQIDGLSPKTLKGYKQHLVRFSSFIKKDVQDITTMDLRMFLAVLTKNQNLKNTSVETEKSILKSFFNWLEQEDYITKSPARALKPGKVSKKLRGSLSVEEIEILKDSCITLRERAIIETFYATGARLDEIQKLNRDDIDWQNMRVKVLGKGNKERFVPISSKAKIHIQKYLMSRLDDCEALFVTERKPYHRMGHRAIQREVKKIGVRSGIKKNVFPHLIRHSTATIMLNNGAELAAVQNLLGHTDPGTTQVYLDVDNQYVYEQYKKYFVQ